jgi:hypothetical protein
LHDGSYIHYKETEKVLENNLGDVLEWFDEKSWYPLGRETGKNSNPGLATIAAIFHKLRNYTLLNSSLLGKFKSR